MKKSLIVALAAGACVAPAALAQEYITLPFGGERRVQPDKYPATGYESRAIQVVYDNVTNVFGNGTGGTFLGNNNQILEDVRFTNSPWNGTTGRLMTEITWGVAVLTAPTSTDERMFLVFWDEDDMIFDGFTGVGTNMIRSGAVPIAVVTVDPGVNNAGFIYQFTIGLTGLPGGGVAIPDDDNGIVLQAGWANTAAVAGVTDWSNLPAGTLREACPSANLRGLAFGSNSLQPASNPTANPCTVGSTTKSYGRDMLTAAQCTNAGAFIGSAQGTTLEHRLINVAPAGGPNAGVSTTYGYQVRFRGDVPPPPPPPNTDLGCIADAGVATTGSVAAGEVDWFAVCLNGDASDPTLTFFNVDTEGSAGDVAIALYDSAGAVTGIVGGVSTAVDDGSGSGTNDQLTFGVRSIAAAAGGRDYDGRNGQLPAGQYYIAVAPSGSSFAPGFTASASANPGGSYNLNLTTNVNGSPLPAVTAPQITGVDYDQFGPIDPMFPGGDARPGIGATTGTRNVTWHKFTLANPTDAAHFLDGDFFALSGATADGMAFIFDSTGALLALTDDEGEALQPQFSSGAAGSRTYGGNTVPFDGNLPVGMPALPAGTYYVATGLFPMDFLSLQIVPDRFHVRGTSGSNLTLGFDLYAGGAGGPPCDPDVNQDGNVDQDDVSYLIGVVAGGPNPTGIDPDFNQDGNVDQDDVAALINVVAGGPCP
jgi:hypothetical protein